MLDLQSLPSQYDIADYHIRFVNADEISDFDRLPLDLEDAVYQYILSFQKIIDSDLGDTSPQTVFSMQASLYFIKMNFARVFVRIFDSLEDLFKGRLIEIRESSYEITFWIAVVGLPLGLLLKLFSIPVVASIFERMDTPLKLLTELKPEDLQSILKQLASYRKLNFPILLAYRKKTGSNLDKALQLSDDSDDIEEQEEGDESLRMSTNLSKYGSLKMLKSITTLKVKDLLRLQTHSAGTNLTLTKEQQMIQESLKTLKTMKTKRIIAGMRDDAGYGGFGGSGAFGGLVKKGTVFPRNASKYLVAQELHAQQELMAAADSFRLAQQAGLKRSGLVEKGQNGGGGQALGVSGIPEEVGPEKKGRPVMSIKYSERVDVEEVKGGDGEPETPLVMVDGVSVPANHALLGQPTTRRAEPIKGEGLGKGDRLLGKKNQIKPKGVQEVDDENDEGPQKKTKRIIQESRVKAFIWQLVLSATVFFPWIVVNLGYQISYMNNIIPIYDHALLASQVSQRIHYLYSHTWESVCDRKILTVLGRHSLHTLGSDKVAETRDSTDQAIRRLSNSHSTDLPSLGFDSYLQWYTKILSDDVCTSPTVFGLVQSGDQLTCLTIESASREMSTVFGTALIANATGEMGNLAMLLFRIVDTVSTAAGRIAAIQGSFTAAQNMSAVQYSSKRRLTQFTNSSPRRMALHRTSDGDIENHDD